MSGGKVKGSNGLKLGVLCFITVFIGGYAWQLLIHTAVAVYFSKKLGGRSEGMAAMSQAFLNDPAYNIAAYAVMEIIVVLIALLFLKRYNDGKSISGELGMRINGRSIRLFLLGFGIVVPMQAAMYGILTAFKVIEFKGLGFGYHPAGEVIGSTVLMLAVMAFPGFCEEIAFRGVIMRYMLKSRGRVFSIIASSALFSIIHVGIYPDPANLAAVFIIGLVLGYLYAASGSLYLPIGLHMGWDFFSEITKCGDVLFNVRKLFIFDVLMENNTVMLAVPVFIYLLVLAAAAAIFKKKPGSVPDMNVS